MNNPLDSARGCLFGLAFGDALGAATEFLSVPEILYRRPPAGPTEISGSPALVTDDTQMAMAVAEALLEAKLNRSYQPESLEGPLRRHFLTWLDSPDNNRAPGMTCLTACEKLKRGEPWREATGLSSKGCGANMRVAPVGLLGVGPAAVDEGTRAAIAQFQAALTHGHPTALAAADLTAITVAELIRDGNVLTLPARLRTYAESQRLVYHEEWLGALWQRPGVDSPEAFINRGWTECLNVLDRLENALERHNTDNDPCEATGDGWVAEEAFATGLLCFLLFPDEPLKAIQRAAVTRGDSDSIGCLAGAFAGARLGAAAWPDQWYPQIEYSARLERLAVGLVQ